MTLKTSKLCTLNEVISGWLYYFGKSANSNVWGHYDNTTHGVDFYDNQKKVEQKMHGYWEALNYITT